jgi:hypothetical protein
MLELVITKRTDPRLLQRMEVHYSHPKGFVGRNICYAILYNGVYYGHIVGGSATKFLPNRNELFGITSKDLNHIVNNIFFNVSPVDGKYPERNFTTACAKLFMQTIRQDWFDKYGDEVIGFETLVEKPRTGELYKRAGWRVIGETKGYTCKRIAGKGTDSWGGKRVWNTNKDELKPKLVLIYPACEVTWVD